MTNFDAPKNCVRVGQDPDPMAAGYTVDGEIVVVVSPSPIYGYRSPDRTFHNSRASKILQSTFSELRTNDISTDFVVLKS